MHSLKFIIAQDGATVCFISIPAYLYGDYEGVHTDPLIRSIEHLADSVFELESFSGSVRQVDQKYTSDYSGLLHVSKVAQLASGQPHTRMNSVDLHGLGFKVRRKRFEVEAFLPPPLDEEAPNSTAGGGCSSAALEF